MEHIDLKLKLFGGRSIYAQGYGDISPLKVKDVIDVGYSEYMKYLNIMTLETKDFIEDDSDGIHVFDLLVSFGGEEIEKMFEMALSFFLKGEALVDKDNSRVFVKRSDEEVFVITKDNYIAIQDVIKWQNYINSFDEKKLNNFNPANAEAQRLKMQMDAVAKKRDELKKRQSQDDESESGDIDFYDILSSISSKSFGVNELNVAELTIYQVYRKFKRMEIIDQYDISIKSMLAGAKDVKLRHWSSKD